MHSKHKGTIAETKVVADLYQKGISVAVVVDDLLPIDLIAIKDNNLYKLQVKYTRLNVKGKHNKTETIELKLRNCMSNKNLSYTKCYTTDEVDIFAVYVPEIDKCLYIKSNILKTHKFQFTIRFGATANGQANNCNFAEDYFEFPTSL